MTGAVALPITEHGRSVAGAPGALPIALAHDLRRATRELAREGDVDLTAGAREALRWRKADLDYALSPINEDALDRILVSLSTMVAQATPGADGKLALRLARHDLKPLPEFALRAAAEDFRRGAAGDGKFRPTIAELSRLARLKALRFAEERSQIERVLGAKPRRRIDPLEKARVAEGLRACVGEILSGEAERDLEKGSRKGAPHDERSLEAILEEHARRGPVTLGRAAAHGAIAAARRSAEAPE